MTEVNESKFGKVFEYATLNIFDEREQFGEVIASKLFRHGYIFCNEDEVLNYIKDMLGQADISFDVQEEVKRSWVEYKVTIN